MAYYSCTTIGCSDVTPTVTPYTSLPQCQTACVGWGCGPSPDLAPDADILFVFDFSGSLTYPTVWEYFLATTAWTQTLTNAGWVGNANWVGSQDFENNSLNHMITFTANDGTPVSILSGSMVENWLAWGSIPYWGVNTDTNGNKDFVSGGPTIQNTSCPSWGWCGTLGGPNPLFTPSQQNILDQYFTKYTIRKNIATTGFTYPTNDQLVITISEINAFYLTDVSLNNGNGDPGATFKSEYRLWDKIWTNKPAGRNYEAWAIPATHRLPQYPTEAASSQSTQRHEARAKRFMLATIDVGNQDEMSILDSVTGLSLGTGTQDGTWILIPNGSTNLDGSTCSNTNGCSTVPGGDGSANPCVYNGNNGSPANPAPGGAFDPNQPYSPCYDIDAWDGLYETGWDGSVNSVWNAGWGGLGTKGWSHRAWDDILDNPQTDLINLLNGEIVPSGTWVPVDCFSAETNYSLSTTHPYSSYAACIPCIPQWHCDLQGNPCYSAYTSGGPNWYATEQLCQAACNTTPIWSCATEGCVSGYTFPGTTYATSALCASDCVGWGCESQVTDLNADV